MRNVKCRNCAEYLEIDWCHKVIDSPDPDRVRDCKYYHSRTNRIKLSRMTDEELATLLSGMSCRRCPIDCPGGLQNCADIWLDWLRQEAKNDT